MLFTEKMKQEYLRLCKEESESKEESTQESVDKTESNETGENK